MGPRRRLELAVKQVKEENEQQPSSNSFRQTDSTPTPGSKEIETDLKVQVARLQSALTQVYMTFSIHV